MLAATILVVLAPARTARAQQNIPDAVITSSQITPEGKGQIAEYIKSQEAGLSGDAEKIRTAKNKLSAPLTNIGMTESFRREYGLQLLPVLVPLATSPKEEVAINALRLAGLMGTKAGLDVALKGLDDKRQSVRVMAAMSVGLSISTGRAKDRTALSSRNATDALTVLNDKMVAEQNPRVLDAMMLALDAAMKVKQEDLADVRTKATAYLLAATKRIAARENAPGLDQALSHAVKAIGEAMLDAGADKLPPASVTEAACVAGDVVAGAQRRLDASPTDAERSLLGLIAQQCERIVQQAATALETKAPVYNFDDLIHESKDAEFKAAAQRLYHDLGVAPFGCIPADRYPKP